MEKSRKLIVKNIDRENYCCFNNKKHVAQLCSEVARSCHYDKPGTLKKESRKQRSSQKPQGEEQKEQKRAPISPNWHWPGKTKELGEAFGRKKKLDSSNHKMSMCFSGIISSSKEPR